MGGLEGGGGGGCREGPGPGMATSAPTVFCEHTDSKGVRLEASSEDTERETRVLPAK